MSATPEEIAWAAGLFEGEGSMTARGKTSVTLKLCMTDFDAVRSFHRIVGAGTLDEIDRRLPHYKKQLGWRTTDSAEVRRILEALLPWFHERRRARAAEMLERLAANTGAPSKRTRCKRGHPLSGSNLGTNTMGNRFCRACRTEVERARRWRRGTSQAEKLF